MHEMVSGVLHCGVIRNQLVQIGQGNDNFYVSKVSYLPNVYNISFKYAVAGTVSRLKNYLQDIM